MSFAAEHKGLTLLSFVVIAIALAAILLGPTLMIMLGFWPGEPEALSVEEKEQLLNSLPPVEGGLTTQEAEMVLKTSVPEQGLSVEEKSAILNTTQN